MSDRPVFVYAATYSSTDDAWGDYDILLDLHAEKLVGTYDAAVINKDDKGKVHVHKHEKATQHGAWGGIGWCARRGAVPAIDHRRGGGRRRRRWPWRTLPQGRLPRRREGAQGDAGRGTAALVVIGESSVEEQPQKALTHAEKSVEKEVDADSTVQEGPRGRGEGTGQAGSHRELDPTAAAHVSAPDGGREAARQSNPRGLDSVESRARSGIAPAFVGGAIQKVAVDVAGEHGRPRKRTRRNVRTRLTDPPTAAKRKPSAAVLAD